MDTTQVVAWWGAVVATLVFVWDVYKWATEGARLRLNVKTNMKLLGNPLYESDTFVIVDVTNIGGKATTLKMMTFVWHRSWWQRLRGKSQKDFLSNPGGRVPLPVRLDVGDVWQGLAKQSNELAELSRAGYLYCEISHSSRQKPASSRVWVKAD